MDSDGTITSILTYITSYQSSNSFTKFDLSKWECVPQYIEVNKNFVFPSNSQIDQVAIDYLGRMLYKGKKTHLQNELEVVNRLFMQGTGQRRKIGVTNYTNFDQINFKQKLKNDYFALPPLTNKLPIQIKATSASTPTKQTINEVPHTLVIILNP